MNNKLNQSQTTDRKHKSLTPQQITYLTSRIQGKSKEESKRIARYSPTTSTHLIESNPNMRDALLTCMRNNGLTEDFLAEKLMQGMNAKKTHFVTYEGEITEERTIEDSDIQFKHLKTAFEIRGDIKSNTIETLNLGIVQLPTKKSVDDWNKDELPSDNTNNANEEKID